MATIRTVSTVLLLSCVLDLINQASGFLWGKKDKEDEEVIVTTVAVETYDDAEIGDFDGWRRNILVVGGLVILIGGTLAILYCCCRMFASPPDEDATQTQEDPEQGDNNERFPRDSFYAPPPRYSALIRSQSQRKARIDVLKKKELENSDLPRYSAAVRQFSEEDPVNENITATTPILVATEAIDDNLISHEENRSRSSLINPQKQNSDSDEHSWHNDNATGGALRHAASCSDLIDSPLKNVVLRKKLLQRTNSDPPCYSDYLYQSTPKL